MKTETKVNVSRLIVEMHKRPALWDQKHPQYLNRDVTASDWVELSAVLKAPKQALKTKWKGLRDTFRTELKKELVYRRTKLPKHLPTWRHFGSLQFLKDQMMPKRPVWENPIMLEQATETDLPSEETQQPKLPPVRIVLGRKMQAEKRERALRILSSMEQQRRRSGASRNAGSNASSDETNGPYIVTVKEETNGDNLLDETCENNLGSDHFTNSDDNVNAFVARNMSPFQVFTPEINGENSEESAVDPIESQNRLDDNYHFFMSLLPHFNKLSDERRMLLRMQIQEMVYKEVYKNLN